MAGFPTQTPQQQQTQPLQQPPSSRHLPSDLRSKIARCYVDDREFKDDTGRTVKYSRLVVEFYVGEEAAIFEARIGKNDKALLAIADDFSAGRSF
mgnify:FL=1